MLLNIIRRLNASTTKIYFLPSNQGIHTISNISILISFRLYCVLLANSCNKWSHCALYDGLSNIGICDFRNAHSEVQLVNRRWTRGLLFSSGNGKSSSGNNKRQSWFKQAHTFQFFHLSGKKLKLHFNFSASRLDEEAIIGAYIMRPSSYRAYTTSITHLEDTEWSGLDLIEFF